MLWSRITNCKTNQIIKYTIQLYINIIQLYICTSVHLKLHTILPSAHNTRVQYVSIMKLINNDNATSLIKEGLTYLFFDYTRKLPASLIVL